MPKLSKVKGKFDSVIDCFSSYCLIEDDFKIYLNNVKKNLKKMGVFIYKFYQKILIYIKNISRQKKLKTQFFLKNANHPPFLR